MSLNGRDMQLSRRDDGFTLVELMIVMILLGIITLPLGNAVLAFVRNTDATTARLGESHDAQISSAYFAQDIASIGTHDWSAYPYPLKQSVETGVAYDGSDGSKYPCGSAGTPNALVRMAWDDFAGPSSPPTSVVVSYFVKTVGAEQQLHRIRCVGSTTPTSDLVMVHHLDASGPTITCSTVCTGSGAAVPQYVTLVLRVRDPSAANALYTVTLTGQRRQT
jgi:prepilin-type N-terminal cleavage/methylation domain-containing protein